MDVSTLKDQLQIIVDQRMAVLQDTALTVEEKKAKLAIFDRENDELNQSIDVYFRLVDFEGFSEYEALMGLKASIEYVDTALATKADQSTVDTALAIKADQSTVDTALATKVDQSTFATALATKVDQSKVDTALASKADQSTVDTALVTKASKQDLEDVQKLTDTFIHFRPALQDLGEKGGYIHLGDPYLDHGDGFSFGSDYVQIIESGFYMVIVNLNLKNAQHIKIKNGDNIIWHSVSLSGNGDKWNEGTLIYFAFFDDLTILHFWIDGQLDSGAWNSILIKRV